MKSFVLEGPGGIPGLKQVPSGGSVTTSTNWVFSGNVTVQGTLSAAQESITSEIITAANANAFAVGPAGTTNPTFNVDTSTTSAATGLNVKSAAAGSGLAITVISSGTNENLSIAAKGSGTLTISSPTIITAGNANGLAVGPNGTTNPAFKVDSSASSSVTGIKVVSKASGSGAFVGVISSATNESLHLNAQGSGNTIIGDLQTGNVQFLTATAVPAGGSSALALLLSSTASFGIYAGTGAPTVSAAQGSLYFRRDGSSTSTRLYVNTDGGTTWTNVTTAA